MATHSVRRHLRLEIEAYDETIRRFIPGYETMIEVAAREVAAGAARSGRESSRARRAAGIVLDLGGGTGALAEAILAHPQVGAVALIDVDAEMLAQARARLARFRRAASTVPRPVVSRSAARRATESAASLALHHVRSTGRQARALRGGSTRR